MRLTKTKLGYPGAAVVPLGVAVAVARRVGRFGFSGVCVLVGEVQQTRGENGCTPNHTWLMNYGS